MTSANMKMFLEERDESPRPSKRRNSGPTMEHTPRPFVALPKRVRLLPKAPAAPLFHALPMLALPGQEDKPELFLPSFHDLASTTAVPVTSRLVPRKSRPPSPPLWAMAQAKALQRSKAVPAPNGSTTLKQSRSCHALCA